MKYYTTVEQSNKLVELNIPVDTADMSYILTTNKAGNEIWELQTHPPYDEFGEIPCWSTEALLDILDETIVTEEDDEYRLNFGKDGTSYYMFYEDVYRLVNNVIDELDFSCSTLLECAFEMIVKLKEMKLI